jgi:hypothetical protein
MATVTAQWWGIQIGLTHDEAVSVESGDIAKTLDSVTASALGKIVWWLGILFTLWVLVETQWMKAVDRGNGVYLNLAWWPTISWWQWWCIFPSTR